MNNEQSIQPAFIAPADDSYDGDESCDTCGGSGEILVCCDDICHGLGECIHGDGMAVCPDCKGSGEV